MKAIELENELREVVARMIAEVDLATSQGRLDVNLISEDAWIPILKEVFQCPNLINLNKKQKNFPGIDLGDTQDRVAFQVTASTDLNKVKKTLIQFREKKYASSFDELYIFTITKKQSSYSQDAIDKETNGTFKFNAKIHIIDPHDVLTKITGLRIGAQERLLHDFKIILGDVRDRVSSYENDDQEPLLLATNLAKVSFPLNVYVGEISIDKVAIIESAREQLDYKKNTTSTFTAIRLALVMNGFCKRGWTIHENRLFTFYDLEKETAFRTLIDHGTIESDYFFNNDLDEYRNMFSYLLKNSAIDSLDSHNVAWHNIEKTFFFRPSEDGVEMRKESWVGKKKSTRTVYELKYQTKDPTKVAHHKHLSFDLKFINVEGVCFSVIKPSWLYTFNTYKKSRYHKDLLSKQKRLEFNHSVRDITRFVAYYLKELMAHSHGISFSNLIEIECSCVLPTDESDTTMMDHEV